MMKVVYSLKKRMEMDDQELLLLACAI